ncbi:MAG: metallophosphoesterase, partial [Gammaproteobacteria bacterium]|nr:metallophosphoesterase [Gammaproteobacteria bacterium]
PTEAPTEPLRLLQISDTHLHATTDSRMRGVNTFDTFRAVLDVASRADTWPPDAILVSGDIVQDESRAGYELFRSQMEDLGSKILCLPGNHDDPKLMDEILSGEPFQFCGSYRIGGWSLILLNTFLTGEDAGGLGERRLEALAAGLEEHANQHVLVCMHHQPLNMGSAWLDGVGLRDADRFLEVIDSHSNVRGVLWGHVHQASDRTRGKVRFLSAPSTCSQFLPSSDFFAIDNRPPGMRWLTLHADGKIDTEVVWVESFAA